MASRVLAVFLALCLALPAGWASAVLWVCSAEGVVHVMAPQNAAVPDCCRTGCAHPEHRESLADRCCSDLDDGDERHDGPDRPEKLAALPVAGSTAWGRVSAASGLKAFVARRVAPPAIGPPAWLRHRALLR